MDNREIEQKLRQDIIETTPDILDDLMTELKIEEMQGETVPVSRPAVPRRRRPFKMAGAIAAALFLCIGAFTMFQQGHSVVAVVDFDVNPSIELSIDRQERVVEATAVNGEGEEILADLDLAGVDVNVASYAIVGAMVSRGYLTETDNSILVSVRAKDSARGREIEEQLTASLNEYFGESKMRVAILGQLVDAGDDLLAFADAHGISPGKAWLIRQILSEADPEKSGRKMTEESLLKLSTQELVFLAQGRGVEEESTYGKADDSRYVGEDKAAAAALKHCGLTRSGVKGLKVELDCDDGAIIYEVEFTGNGTEYEVDVDAKTGKILAAEKETAGRGRDVDDDRDDDDDRDVDDDRDDRDDDRYDDDDDDDHDDDRDDRDDDDDDDDD